MAGRLMVLNAGSSSLKFKLFSLQPLTASVGGLIERIGDVSNSTLVAKGSDQRRWTEQVPIPDHVSALERIIRFLSDAVSPSMASEVVAVGHRVVHGLDLTRAAMLTDDVVAKIHTASALAPLHNPPGLQGIRAAQQVFRGVPQVGVFDTAYHQTMPPHAYTYGLPHELCQEHRLRRYGFHGTSHKYLAETAAQLLGKPLHDLNAITCHLGAGSSMAAIKGGASVDTTMGLTPLEGLLMGTRAGDMDPAIPLHLMGVLGVGAKEVDALLNKKSGLLGVSGHADLRAVLKGRDEGDARCALAVDMFVYRVQKYVGAYSVALGGRVDALVFSAGIGENSAAIRALVASGLQGLGVDVDAGANAATVGGVQGDIATRGSKVRVLVIPTDEELSIAQQTLEVVSGAGKGGAATAA